MPGRRGPGGGSADWVPLFIDRRNSADPTGPLVTVIQPTPRRTRFDRGELAEGGYPGSPTESETSARSFPSPNQRATDTNLLSPSMFSLPAPHSYTDAQREPEGVSSSLSPRLSPRLAQMAGFVSTTMQRTASSTSLALSRGLGHARRRSSESVSEMHSLISFPPSQDEARRHGLRTMMGHGGAGQSEELKQTRSTLTKLLLAVVACGLLIPLSQHFLSSRLPSGRRYTPPSASSTALEGTLEAELKTGTKAKTSASDWWQALPHAIYNHFETVPYNTATHPRTPPTHDDDSFAAYLTTRLGSHFSTPGSASKDPGGPAAGQLWLTTADSKTVNLATRHLRAWLAERDRVGQNADSATRQRDGHDIYARRELVTLCLDAGCLDACRRDESRYCFGGFRGLGEQEAKQVAIIEALESGRRVFLVDPGVYFHPDDDPVKYLGPLRSSDLQIPEFWTTSMVHNAGFALFNPTAAVISLFYRMVEISHLSSIERASWATTNLLLDPTGASRGVQTRPPSDRTKQTQDNEQDEGLYDEDALSAGYGQAEFQSAWAGGLDVKVLSRQKFTPSTTALFAAHAFSRGKAVWFHCACCGAPSELDFIAGSFGFHFPTVLYPAPDPHLGFPEIPLALRTQGMKGTPDELRFAVSVLLQLTQDTGRTFVPPIQVTLDEPEGSSMRYWWRTFPVQRWRHNNNLFEDGPEPDAVLRAHVREPNFIVHAIEHLRKHYWSAPRAVSAVMELETPTLVDLAAFESYEEALREMQRGVLQSTRVVEVEGWEAVRDRPGWAGVRERQDEVEMCMLGKGQTLKLTSGTCEVLCRLPEKKAARAMRF